MNTKFNYDNSIKFILLFLLSIFKTIIFIANIILYGINGVDNKPTTGVVSTTPGRPNNTMLLIFGGLFVLSLVFRIFFVRNLRNDEVFKQSGLDVEQYLNGFKFIPLITSIVLIIKSHRDKNPISNDWTTRQLILKWKIINFVKDLIVLFWVFSIVFAIFSLIHYLRFGSDNTIFEQLRDALIIIFIGFFYLLIPFYLLASYSLKIYRLIKKREITYWKSASYVFFMAFFYLKAWKNVLRLSKKLKIRENTLVSQNEVKTQVINNKIIRQFYQFTIVKNIFHLIFLIVFTVTMWLAVTKNEIFRNPGVALILFNFFNISTMTYLLYIVPRYLADSVNIHSKRTSLILYILDIFVPIVSIYNLIKYKQNKTILV
ncbi:hypothetical protein [Mesomycoplasma ovipneumoniae]|uniref:hypothetical protein n=1 Tax=Mesomycoplasma ovipneumoniae TaxID=29562 RepID=UPI0029644D7E|nr:hypothetical protein [Mesomycoplasma ovipneumoniae]MDW2912384.1 hypothetical protein [Mesomycoplasma ovipneumoniae]MDW2918417.1 hypothetical protein [Mesomycoplasma ovipneumoniae]MDW2925775.1 hypothetical protein [Mesomycoplasma ovipneumoniae]MDW2929368.1 hypothetical protein [Mesomycoplasma ovipneumoniae]